MARDLGTGAGEVHRAAEVLRFWLEEVPPERRFARDDALDAQIRDRFGTLVDAVVESHAAGWRSDPKTLLAAIILTDQFSRNLHRGSGRAFAADPLARALAREALVRGWDAGLGTAERQFLYIPFMHSETMADQLLSLKLFDALGDAFVFDFARRHAEQIARFGRFPQRNEALGREMTAEEAAFLSRPDARF